MFYFWRPKLVWDNNRFIQIIPQIFLVQNQITQVFVYIMKMTNDLNLFFSMGDTSLYLTLQVYCHLVQASRLQVATVRNISNGTSNGTSGTLSVKRVYGLELSLKDLTLSTCCLTCCSWRERVHRYFSCTDCRVASALWPQLRPPDTSDSFRQGRSTRGLVVASKNGSFGDGFR